MRILIENREIIFNFWDNNLSTPFDYLFDKNFEKEFYFEIFPKTNIGILLFLRYYIKKFIFILGRKFIVKYIILFKDFYFFNIGNFLKSETFNFYLGKPTLDHAILVCKLWVLITFFLSCFILFFFLFFLFLYFKCIIYFFNKYSKIHFEFFIFILEIFENLFNYKVILIILFYIIIYFFLICNYVIYIFSPKK